MKQKILSALLFLLSLTTNLNAQTIWNGPLMTFTKAAFANHTLAANQDRITASTWITRAGIRGIFNIFSETSYIDDISPSNTEWATGTLANYATLTYLPWQIWGGGINNIPSIVGRAAVLHLISENIYIGITFTSWGVGAGSGGSFSYQRTTAPIAAPVRLVNFNVARKNNALQLNWKTAFEENTFSFSIERSGDGKQFASIGTIKASGNSSTEKLYSFTDAAPLPVNFYRLRTNDNDGTISYSNIVAFKLAKDKGLHVFPVPASDVLYVQTNNPEKKVMQLIDAMGRISKCLNLAEGSHAFALQIHDLKAGVYYLKMGAESKMFVKQ